MLSDTDFFQSCSSTLFARLLSSGPLRNKVVDSIDVCQKTGFVVPGHPFLLFRDEAPSREREMQFLIINSLNKIFFPPFSYKNGGRSFVLHRKRYGLRFSRKSLLTMCPDNVCISIDAHDVFGPNWQH